MTRDMLFSNQKTYLSWDDMKNDSEIYNLSNIFASARLV